MGAIEQLTEDLTQEFARDPKGAGVVALLEAYCKSEDDWKRFAHFAPEGYTRNLVTRTDGFDLIVLCWDKGQESPIHNHEAQRCWMGVLEGLLDETHCYERAEGPPERREPKTYAKGQVAFIMDDIALHIIGAAGDAPGVSLHLYAQPYDECNIYCPETGKVSRKQLSFHSRGGVVGA